VIGVVGVGAVVAVGGGSGDTSSVAGFCAHEEDITILIQSNRRKTQFLIAMFLFNHIDLSFQDQY